MLDAYLVEIFDLLHATYGPRHWWPAETPFEVCVGAILTQNTNWGNVEKAIGNLKGSGILSPEALRDVPADQLADTIRPAGYFNVKSVRLKDFVGYLWERHGGSLERMFAGEWRQLREELLRVRGIGPETADSILLYAGDKPTFVVDAYTRRLFTALGVVDRRRLRGAALPLHDQPAAGRAALQRIPRPHCGARQAPLPQASPLRWLRAPPLLPHPRRGTAGTIISVSR